MSDEKQHHKNPLGKLRLPWIHQHKDDGSGTASEKKRQFPWKHNKDDGSGTASEKQALLSNSSTPPPYAPDDSAAGGAVPKHTKHMRKHKKTSFGTANPSVSRVWDVKMPPSKMKMVEGTFGSERQRISVEIHSELASDRPPSASLLRGDSLDTKGNDKSVGLCAGDTVEVRLLKPVSNKKGSGGSNEGSDRGLHAADDATEVWITNYIFGLDNIKIIKARGSHIKVKLGSGDETQIRHVNFSTEKDATSFKQVLENLREMEDKLKEQRLKMFRERYPTLAKGEHKHIRLLIEIVSAINLPDSDGDAPNPFVIVSLGASNEVHRTEPIHDT